MSWIVTVHMLILVFHLFVFFFRRRLRKKRKMWISGTFQAIILFSTRKPKQNVCSHYLIKLYVLDLAQRQANCTYNDDVYTTYHSFCILFRLNYICFERIFPMMEFFAINSDFIWRTDNLKQQQRKKALWNTLEATRCTVYVKTLVKRNQMYKIM